MIDTPNAAHAVLGSALIDPEAAKYIFHHLDEKYFTDPRDRRLYRVIHDMHKKGTAVDITTITEYLSPADKKTITMGHLTGIFDSVQTALNVRHYSNLLIKGYHNREHNALLEKLKEDPTDEKIQKKIREHWDALNGSGNAILHISELGPKYMDILEARRSGKLTAYMSGYKDFDELTGGFSPGALVCLGARTSVGKTSFLVNLLTRYLERGHKVLMASAEMTWEEILDRITAISTNIFAKKLSKGNLTNVDFPKIVALMGELCERQLHFIEGGRMSMSRLRLATEVTKPDIVIVDFIQRFSPPNYNIPRAAYYSDVANGLKDLAKERRMVVIAASQLNRDIEKRDKEDPKLSDFKESGGIEEAGDYSIMLTRKKQDPSQTTDTITAHINKARNGPCGNVKFSFEKSFTLFKEVPNDEYSNNGEETEKPPKRYSRQDTEHNEGFFM